jgi:hypothetical protein
METETLIVTELTPFHQWWQRCIEKGLKEPFGESIVLNEESAAFLLTRNKSNRPIKQRLIDQIGRDGSNDRYALNGEPLIISKEGWLNDGQHRCLAVVKYKITIKTMIVFGIDRDTNMTLDQGVSRSISNFLEMEGVPHPKYVSVVLKLILTYEVGLDTRSVNNKILRITRQDMLNAYHQKYGKDIQYAIETFGVISTFAKSVNSVAPISAAHILISESNSKHLVDPFFDILTGIGTNISLNSIAFLRQKLISMKSKEEAGRAENKLEAIIRYWNSYTNKRELKNQIQLKGKYPEIDLTNQNN